MSTIATYVFWAAASIIGALWCAAVLALAVYLTVGLSFGV